jgi:hypothetical protein
MSRQRAGWVVRKPERPWAALPRGGKVAYRQDKHRPPEAGLCDRGTDYILSSVFFILVDGLDLAIFFLLILSFDMSPFDMLSLWAAGPVVAGLFVSVD